MVIGKEDASLCVLHDGEFWTVVKIVSGKGE
jgi:hypothetical protein